MFLIQGTSGATPDFTKGQLALFKEWSETAEMHQELLDIWICCRRQSQIDNTFQLTVRVYSFYKSVFPRLCSLQHSYKLLAPHMIFLCQSHCKSLQEKKYIQALSRYHFQHQQFSTRSWHQQVTCISGPKDVPSSFAHILRFSRALFWFRYEI